MLRQSRLQVIEQVKRELALLNVDELEEVDREAFRLRLDLFQRRATHHKITCWPDKLSTMPPLPEETDDSPVGQLLDKTA